MCRTELLIENRMPHKESHHSQIVSNLSNRGKNQNSIFYKQDLNVSVTKCNKGKYLCALCSNEHQPKPRDDKNDVSTDIKRWNLLQIQRTFFKCATKKSADGKCIFGNNPFQMYRQRKKVPWMLLSAELATFPWAHIFNDGTHQLTMVNSQF